MAHTDLSSYNNEWYQPGPGFKRGLWYLCSLLFFRNAIFPFYAFKTFLLRLFGAKIGKGLVIKPMVYIKYPWLLSVGDHCWIGEGVWIDNLAPVTIADHVCLSQGAMLLCGNHDYTSTAFDLKTGRIKLENGVWIGAKALVGPGVTCHSHSMLTAGSVATGDLQAYSIYQGNPSTKTRERVINTV